MIYYVYNPPRAIKIVRKESKPKKQKNPSNLCPPHLFRVMPRFSCTSEACTDGCIGAPSVLRKRGRVVPFHGSKTHKAYGMSWNQTASHAYCQLDSIGAMDVPCFELGPFPPPRFVWSSWRHPACQLPTAWERKISSCYRGYWKKPCTKWVQQECHAISSTNQKYIGPSQIWTHRKAAFVQPHIPMFLSRVPSHVYAEIHHFRPWRFSRMRRNLLHLSGWACWYNTSGRFWKVLLFWIGVHQYINVNNTVT